MPNNKKKSFAVLRKILLIINIVVAATLLLSYLAPLTDPKDFPIIAILGFGYQVFMILNIMFSIYWLIVRKIYALISIGSLLLGINILLSNFRFRAPFEGKQTIKKDVIRIMSYNVRGFNGIGIYENTPIQKEVAQLVNGEKVDVVNFVEYNEGKPDSEVMIKIMEKTLTPCFHYFKTFNSGTDFLAGNAIFTKYPIVDTGSIKSPKFLEMKAIFADIKYKGIFLRIYCIHLAPVKIGTAKDKVLKGEIDLDKFSVIKSGLAEAFIKRSYQVSKIKEHLSKCPYPYIVTGDFNDTPISYAVNEIGDGLKNAFIEKGSGLGTTFYSTFPKLHIDYIFASPQFDVLDYYEINKEMSDHKPVISDLEIK